MTDTATVDPAVSVPNADSATVEVDASLLREQLGLVCPAAAGHSWLPALMTVRLTAEGEALTARATDSTWGVEAITTVRANGGFDLCVEAKRLHGLVGTFTVPDSKVLLEVDGTTMTVRCGRSVSRFHTISPDEFPSFPDGANALLECCADRVKLAADLSAWAASRETASPLVGNVCVTVREDPHDPAATTVRFEATDRYVIATWDGFDDTPVPLTRPAGVESRFLIPGKTLTELGRIAGRLGDKRVKLFTAGPEPENPNHVALRATTDTLEFTVFVRCLQRTNDKGEDIFPDLKKMVDHHYQQGAQLPTMVRATFDARQAQASLDRILPFSSDVLANGQAAATGKAVRLTLTHGWLEMESKTTEGEQAYDAIEATTEGSAEDQRVTTKFGSDLLEKVLKAVCAADPEGGVTLQVPSPGFPSVFHPIGTPGFMGLLSPLDPGADR